MHGKRGSSDTAVDWFVALLITSIAFVMLGVIVGGFSTRDIDTTTLEPEIMISKVFYELGTDFDERDLQNLSSYTQPNMAAKLSIADLRGNPANTTYINKLLFEEIEPFARLGVRGAGGSHYENFTYPVMYEDVASHLTIEVVVRR